MHEPLTGTGRVAATLLRELLRLGHDVTPIDWRPNALAERLAGRCMVLPPRLPWARTALWHLDLLRRVRRSRLPHDVLLNPTGYPNALGTHPRLVLFVHDLHMLQRGFYRPLKGSWFRTWYGRGLQRAHTLVCVSHHTRDQILRRYPQLDPSHCVVVPNALDDQLGAAVAKNGEARAHFLAVGTIEKRKNVGRLVAAFAEARAAGVEAPLILVGKPGHGAKDQLRSIASLGGAIEVRGAVTDDELARLYRSAIALLFPSLDEGFGLPILEAMRAGTPVLTSDAAAMPEVAGDAALLVDPRDVGSIRDGILRLWREPGLCAELRRRGLVRVAHFEPQAQARALAEVLRQVLEASSPAPASPQPAPPRAPSQGAPPQGAPSQGAPSQRVPSSLPPPTPPHAPEAR